MDATVAFFQAHGLRAEPAVMDVLVAQAVRSRHARLHGDAYEELTQAEIDGFAQRRRFLEDQINTDIDGIGITVDTSARLLALARDEADRAATMAAAERRRFTLGASDFFLVNVREEAVADAQVRRLDAAVRQVVAHADLAAATADLDALGL